MNPHNIGGLAQLARAPALQAGGQRFESVILHSPLPFWGIREAFFDIVTHKTVSEDCFVLTKRSELSRFIEISNTAESMS